MNLNMHYGLSSKLAGTHAFLSPSKPAWVNYDEDKLDRVYFAHEAARRGSEMHTLAHDLIRLGVKLPDIPKTLNLYVNDAIGFRMQSEVLIYFSDNCYGHADCVSFRNNTLRIHDLKTGLSDVSMAQLEIYTALFFLEYDKVTNLFENQIELRIYQNNGVKVHNPEPDAIFHIMDRIRMADKRINELKMED